VSAYGLLLTVYRRFSASIIYFLSPIAAFSSQIAENKHTEALANAHFKSQIELFKPDLVQLCRP
jgi:hypothetical protein